MIRESNADWTIVRPAPFSEAPPHREFRVVTEVGNIVLRKISRGEVARFVVDELETGRFLRRTPFIGHAR